VGTTLGVVALSLSLLAPMRGLRLGLRPSLRFPVGAAPRVRRLAVAGVLTLAGQQLVAAVAIRLANAGAPDGTQVVYAAGLTLFLVPWAALAVPLATSAYPGLAERAEEADEPGFARSLAPVAVLVVAASALAAAVLAAVAGPMARVFLATGSDAAVAALRDTTLAFAPGLLGYGLVALLTRALYARGLWKAPTVCVVGGWLVAVAADVVLSSALPPADRAAALGLGHTLGVTVAGASLLVVVARAAGSPALRGMPQAGGAALLGAVVGGGAGWQVSRTLGADPVPHDVLTAIGSGVAAGAAALVVGLAVMMVAARAPLTTAWRELRTSDRQEVPGG
jgi:putative peptidoglycan lipid II flippase